MGRVVRYIGVGGFLGAGKTTALARLAGYYTGKGLGVGIITNDQAKNLVDTENLQNEGNVVKEVAGGCFCCKFHDLIETIEGLRSTEAVDVILAEPVGSCTDVVATVIQPLIDAHSETIRVAPHSVLIDPVRLVNTLMVDRGGLSSNVAYIYQKQLEEADILVLNKTDTISQSDLVTLTGYLQKTFPGKKTAAVSGLTGAGFPEWLAMIESGDPVGGNITDVDYDVYANGEALLGWLNAVVGLSADNVFVADSLLIDMLSHLKTNLTAISRETAHVKLLLKTGFGNAVANLITNSHDPVVSKGVSMPVTSGVLVINARVEIDPILLKETLREALDSVSKQYGLTVRIFNLESFKPGRPQPTYRYAGPVGA